MIITKENTYIQNLNEKPNVDFPEQYFPQQAELSNLPIGIESSFETVTPVRKSSLS